MSPLVLAFLGDAVYELMVREHIASQGSMPAHTLHMQAIGFVKASAQSDAVDKIMPMLDEEELAIFKRGRNANSTTVPKNANPAQYRRATGLEALFGYLYLNKNVERIREIFDYITGHLQQDQASGK